MGPIHAQILDELGYDPDDGRPQLHELPLVEVGQIVAARDGARPVAVARLGSGPRVASFDMVRLVSLVTVDAPGAEQFVRDTLGDLAPASAELRDALWTFLDEGCNASSAAVRLRTHRNTLLRRLARHPGKPRSRANPHRSRRPQGRAWNWRRQRSPGLTRRRRARRCRRRPCRRSPCARSRSRRRPKSSRCR